MVLMAAPIFTSSYEILLLAFCGFEALLGVYWPSVRRRRRPSPPPPPGFSRAPLWLPSGSSLPPPQ